MRIVPAAVRPQQVVPGPASLVGTHATVSVAKCRHFVRVVFCRLRPSSSGLTRGAPGDEGRKTLLPPPRCRLGSESEGLIDLFAVDGSPRVVLLW